MPVNTQKLIDTLITMKQQYLDNPTTSVRGSHFINILHDYCVQELTNIGVFPNNIHKEARILGSHKPKNVDVVSLIDDYNGPGIIIGIRSQMSSIGKNLLTYYEEIIGDCISLHDRFPMAVICYIYLLPTRPIKIGSESENIDLVKAEQLFKLITDRGDWRDSKDKYEHFAFLKVDFTSDPPKLLDSIPELSIINFFDKIRDTFNKRNWSNTLQPPS